MVTIKERGYRAITATTNTATTCVNTTIPRRDQP
jgi:hypothetical protein